MQSKICIVGKEGSFDKLVIYKIQSLEAKTVNCTVCSTNKVEHILRTGHLSVD